MKALCIIGSPRADGSTAFLVDRMIEGMSESGVQVERFILGNMDIGYCRGCRECEVSRRCVQRDEMDTLVDHIMETDIIVLASPSYWGDVTGNMKVFIDRSLPLCNAKTGDTTVPGGKVGIAVAVRAGSSKHETQHIVDSFEHYFSHLGIPMCARLTAEGIDSPADIQNDPDKAEEAVKLGRTVLSIFSTAVGELSQRGIS